jgi:hypothetical protein
MAVTPLTGVTFQKEGVVKSTAPTVVNFATAAAFDVTSATSGGVVTATVKFPASPFVPTMKLLGSIVSSSYTIINFIEGAALNVTAATSLGITTITITVPSGTSAPYAKIYFGSGAPSTLHNNGDLYFDTAAAYAKYVQSSGAWVSF